MARVQWSLTAEEDLREIEEYIARDSSTYAVRTVNRIVEAVELLSLFPFSGRMVPEFQREDLREVISGSFRVVHLVKGQNVSILRVVHGARDIVALSERQPWDSIV